MNTTASAAIGQPTARRVASSSSSRPMVATAMSIVFGWPGRVASCVVEQQQVGAGQTHRVRCEHPVECRHAVARRAAERSATPRRPGRARGPRCSARASVSLRMPMPNVNGSGDAYQSWEQRPGQRYAEDDLRGHAGRLASAGVGIGDELLQRLGRFLDVSGHAGSRDESANEKRGEGRLRPPACGAGRGPYLIQPFSL